jgi:hypothetical protein
MGVVTSATSDKELSEVHLYKARVTENLAARLDISSALLTWLYTSSRACASLLGATPPVLCRVCTGGAHTEAHEHQCLSRVQA